MSDLAKRISEEIADVDKRHRKAKEAGDALETAYLSGVLKGIGMMDRYLAEICEEREGEA